VRVGERRQWASIGQTKLRIATACALNRPPPNGSSVYEATDAKVVPFKQGKVSLPETVENAPRVLSLVDPFVRDYLEWFDECLMLPPSAREHAARGPGIRTYMDPILRSHGGAYRRFAGDIAKRGLPSLTQKHRQRCTPFFVAKKDGVKQRLILECRAVNEMFALAPSTSLCTGETLSKLEVESDEAGNYPEVRFSGGDVADCLHRLRTWDELSSLFVCPGSLLEKQERQRWAGGSWPQTRSSFPCWGCLPRVFVVLVDRTALHIAVSPGRFAIARKSIG
jgi:hypothetical protein